MEDANRSYFLFLQLGVKLGWFMGVKFLKKDRDMSLILALSIIITINAQTYNNIGQAVFMTEYATTAGAVCLDGTPGLFYIAKGAASTRKCKTLPEKWTSFCAPSCTSLKQSFELLIIETDFWQSKPHKS